MEIAIKVLQLILSLSLLVFVHELGHFLAARAFGIRVEKFYIFFDAGGFSLFKFKIGDTTFGMGWIPFGGYCKISGMIDESLDTEAMKQPPKPWEFRSKPAWQRLIVMISGVVMNLLAACVIFIGMSWHWGDRYIDNRDLRWGWAFNELAHEIGFEDGDRIVRFDTERVEGDQARVFSDMVFGRVGKVEVKRGDSSVMIFIPRDKTAEMLHSKDFMTPRFPFVVKSVLPESGAAAAGLLPDDALVGVDGRRISFFGPVRAALVAAAGTTVGLSVLRDSLDMLIERLIPAQVSTEGTLGVMAKDLADLVPVQTRNYNFWQAVPVGMRKAGAMVSNYWQQLKLIFSPKTGAYKSVGSFIAIGNLFPELWHWQSFWFLTAFLSIVLAVMNLLPIPALDGGHVVFLLYEMITRRRPSDKFMERAQIVGMLILLAIIVLAFWNDISRFIIN